MQYRFLFIAFLGNAWFLFTACYQRFKVKNMKHNNIQNIHSISPFIKKTTHSICLQIDKYHRIYSIIDDNNDISPANNGSIYKRVLRKGNRLKGYPQNKDSVEIAWRIYDLQRNLLHDSYNISSLRPDNTTEEEDQDMFSFQLGAEPREVILGWEIGVPTMFEGEIASFTIEPDFAFGIKGAMPLIPPNITIICDIELVKILPSPLRKFKTVGYDESIREELMEQIQSGESPITRPVTHKKTNPNSNETGSEMKFFDPEVHKVDPRLQVKGESDGYMWTENSNVIDIDVKLPLTSKPIHKTDLLIDIKANSIKVCLTTGKVLLEGPLHGKINPSETSWAIISSDDLKYQSNDDASENNFYIGQMLQICLEKSFGFNSIWATVIDRNYLNSKKNENENQDNLYLQ